MSAGEPNGGSGLQWTVLSRLAEGAIRAPRETPEDRNYSSFDPCFRHFAAPWLIRPKSTPTGKKVSGNLKPSAGNPANRILSSTGNSSKRAGSHPTWI